MRSTSCVYQPTPVAMSASSAPFRILDCSMSVKADHLAKVKAHRWQVSSLAFRGDGAKLASAGWDKEVHIWDLSDMKVKTTLKDVHEVPVTCLSWQHREPHLLCAGSADNTAVLWNPDTGSLLHTLKQHTSWVLDNTFCPECSSVATASWDKTVKLWDLETGESLCTLEGHSAGVWSVDFHPRLSHVLCSSGEDGVVRIWDTREGGEVHTLRLEDDSEGICCCKWSPDGTMIACGSSDNKVYIWDMDSTMLINTICSHQDCIKSIAFNTDHNSLIPVLASSGGTDIVLSDPRPEFDTHLLSISPHGNMEADAIAVSPEGSVLASGGRDGFLVLTSLQVPAIKPHNESISERLRNSGAILDQPGAFGSLESLIEVESLSSSDIVTYSATEDSASLRTTTEDSVSLQTTEDMLSLRDLPAVMLKGQDTLDYPSFPGGHSKNRPKKTVRLQDARESRKKRTEKKMSDLPTMIAHFNTSVRGSIIQEMSSSSCESTDEEEEDEPNSTHQSLSNLINVTQKVSAFSHGDDSEPDGAAPSQRLSLLEEGVPSAIRERRKFFQGKSGKGAEMEEEDDKYFPEDSMSRLLSDYYSLMPTEPLSDDTESNEDSYDDEQLSMI